MRRPFLVVIPARAGSKGVPNKNFMKIDGVPLIEYTLNQVKKVTTKDMLTVVSTDSKEGLRIAMQYDVETPLRSENLSTDHAKTVDLLINIIKQYKKNNIEFSNVMLLQPTSPLRSKEDISQAMALFIKNKANSLVSVYELEGIKETYLYKKTSNENGQAISNMHSKGGRRQDEEALYVRNGAIYIVKTDFLLNNNQLISNDVVLYEMPKSRSINIDSMEDINAFAEMVK